VAVFQVSGVFADEVKLWNNKPLADKTYANLQTHFKQANKNRLLSDKTLKETLAAHKALAKANGTVPEGVPEDAKPDFGYCHTHGYCKNLKHTSMTCKFPGPSHKKEATSANKLGGCTTTFAPKGNNGNPNKKKREETAALAKEAAKAAKEAETAAQTAAQATAIAEAVKAAFAAVLSAHQTN
jgi:hypothetical protein